MKKLILLFSIILLGGCYQGEKNIAWVHNEHPNYTKYKQEHEGRNNTIMCINGVVINEVVDKDSGDIHQHIQVNQTCGAS